MFIYGRIGALFRARQAGRSSSRMWNLSSNLERVADESFSIAISMCGNSGQVSIIERTGYQAFYEAVVDAMEGGDPHGVLVDACPYPDAVELILEEAAQHIADWAEDRISESEAAEEIEEGDFFD